MLTKYQEGVVQECLEKGKGALSLPMGSGKTIISIVLALKYYEETKRPSLVVVSKTLIAGWIHEITKFYKESMIMGTHYVVLHGDYIKRQDLMNFTPTESLKIAIATPEMLSKYYTEFNIADMFVIDDGGREGVSYSTVSEPYLAGPVPKGPELFYHTSWAGMFVDEAQKYMNIKSTRTRAIASIYADHKWLLSGTIFYEPKVDLILGYYVIIDDKDFPRSLPSAKVYVRSDQFEGYRKSMVFREKSGVTITPHLIKHVIDFEMTREENMIYLSMRDIMMQIKNKVRKFQSGDQTDKARKFSSYLLACITYLRQIIVCPMIPLASAALDMSSLTHKSELSEIIVNQMEKLGLMEWSDKEENAFSSRMKEVLKIIHNHSTEKVIVITSFRSCLEVFRAFLLRTLANDRPVLTLHARMNTMKRGQVVEEFSQTSNGIFLLTYDIGAEGLNLQKCNNIVLMDTWWNAGKIKQAVARCLRHGQTKDVNAYFLTSHTGIEGALFGKNIEKLDVLEEIAVGKKKSRVTTLDMEGVIRVIDDKGANVKRTRALQDKTWV